MKKRERHAHELRPLLEAYGETGDAARLAEYLVAHSALPGPRGNLELAWAFGDLVEERAEGEGTWDLCARLIEISPERAPVNDPREFLPFCGAIGIGAIGAVSPAAFESALARLRALSRDPRWRMREGVCMGLQRLLARRSQETCAELERWIDGGDPLEMRAAAAAIAEPALLKDSARVATALRMHAHIMDQVLGTTDRRARDFRTLRQALGYTWSVVVAAAPEEGFPCLARLVASGDPDALWIVKQNLKKARLAQDYPEQVASVWALSEER